MTPKQAAILYWRNDNPPQELIAAMAEAQRPLLEALEQLERAGVCEPYGFGQDIRAAIAATKGE